MALFDKPYRYVPQADPVADVSGADVAVVDVVVRDEPEPNVPLEQNAPAQQNAPAEVNVSAERNAPADQNTPAEQRAETAVTPIEIAPAKPDAPGKSDAPAKQQDASAKEQDASAKLGDVPANHVAPEQNTRVVDIAAVPATAPEPQTAVKTIEVAPAEPAEPGEPAESAEPAAAAAQAAPAATAERAAQERQDPEVQPEAPPGTTMQPSAEVATPATVEQPALVVEAAPAPSIVLASDAPTRMTSVELAPASEHGLRPSVESPGLVVFSRAIPPEANPASPRDSQRLINAIDESEPVLDQLRSLAASLHQARTGRELKVIAVTSSVSGEGKTLLAANLALTLSRSYMRQVLLIDADLRRPGLHRLFGIPSQDGIRSALESVRGGLPVAIQEVAPRLALLPAGKPVRDPISSLASDAMQQLVGSAASTFDWVILDTPPVGMLPDVGLLSSLSDAVLLVVEAGRVRYDLVQRTVESIGADRIFGVVLNKVPEREIVASYGMHYYAPYR